MTNSPQRLGEDVAKRFAAEGIPVVRTGRSQVADEANEFSIIFSEDIEVRPEKLTMSI